MSKRENMFQLESTENPAEEGEAWCKVKLQFQESPRNNCTVAVSAYS